MLIPLPLKCNLNRIHLTSPPSLSAPRQTILDIRIIQGHKDVLSNFYPTPLTFKDNTTFDSVEQRYQYVRAMRQKNHKIAEAILMAKHAGEVKAVSKGLFSDYRIADVELMMDLLVTKVEQCSEFRDALRSTKNWSLVHSTSKSDTFWASGLLPTECHQSYNGQNVFGKCLEILRASLREEKSYNRNLRPKSLLNVIPSMVLAPPPRPLFLIPSPIPQPNFRGPNYFEHFPKLPGTGGSFWGPPQIPPAGEGPSLGRNGRAPAFSSHSGSPMPRSGGLPRGGPVEDGQSVPSDEQSPNKCEKCSEPGHTTTECKFRGPARCRHCRQEGHKIKFCELRRAGWGFGPVPLPYRP